MKPKKEIYRQCVVTRKILVRCTLIRIVKTKNNEIMVDLTNKILGRGVYVQRELKTIKLLKQKKIIERIFKTNNLELIYNELESLILRV